MLLADVGTLEPATGDGRHLARAGRRGGRGRRGGAARGRRPRSGDRARWRARRRRWPGGSTTRGGSTACLSAGGSGNTAIATAAMQALPVGVPKLMVSTMAAGDTSDYVGGVDVTMMASVTDVAGINSISARILANAAAAMAGMVLAPAPRARGWPAARGGDDVRRDDALRHARARGARGGAATRCSSSTPPARAGRRWRRSSSGGSLSGVLDMTTTELCDDLVGGVLSAGPDAARGRGARRRAAGGVARRARHGQLRRPRHRPAEVRGPQPLRSQPLGHADAHDAGGMRRARAADRAQARRGDRPGEPVRAARGACR